VKLGQSTVVLSRLRSTWMGLDSGMGVEPLGNAVEVVFE